jgi:hypothetical protein
MNVKGNRPSRADLEMKLEAKTARINQSANELVENLAGIVGEG